MENSKSRGTVNAMSTALMLRGKKVSQRSITLKVKTGTRKNRRPSVAAILRDAYRLHMPDRETRTAVKACLRSA